jgi:hypothetical protein
LVPNVFNEFFSLRVGKRIFTLKFNADDGDFCFLYGRSRGGSGVNTTLGSGIREARRTHSSKQDHNAEPEAHSESHV